MRPHPLPALLVLLTACPPAKPTDTATPDSPADTGTPSPDPDPDGPVFATTHAVLTWATAATNPQDASYGTLALRPPYASLEACVVAIGEPPRIVTDATLTYSIPGNSTSLGKTDFWDHAPALLGEAAPPPDVGLTGLGLEGSFSLVADPFSEHDRYAAPGVPLTPWGDDGTLDPFPLVQVQAMVDDAVVAGTAAVLGVSTEVSCSLCHDDGTGDTGSQVLALHDAREGTTLTGASPVLCGACHAQPGVGFTGDGTSPPLSTALHRAHADQLSAVPVDPPCYACHPGPETAMFRGTHATRGITCTDCHGSMADLAGADREPWVDLPRCDACHGAIGSEYQQEGRSYGDSQGHGGLRCPVCHGTPHAEARSTLEDDNVQNEGLQGYAGVLSACRTCHDPYPATTFPHRYPAAPPPPGPEQAGPPRE